MKKNSKSSRPPLLRRTYIINKKFQYYFIGFILLVCACVVMIDILLCQILAAKFYLRLQMAGVDPAVLESARISVYNVALGCGCILLISLTFVCGICGLAISHKIAGPIYRTLTVLQKLSSGVRVEMPIHLRSNDCFLELENALNSIAEKVQGVSQDAEISLSTDPVVQS